MRTLIASLMLFLLCGVATAGNMTVDAALQNDQFEVTLPANPTTGYQWSLKTYDKGLLNFVEGRYRGPKTRRIGAGGQMVFTFKINAGKVLPKSTKMTFVYARSWEPNTAKPSQVTVNFSNRP